MASFRTLSSRCSCGATLSPKWNPPIAKSFRREIQTSRSPRLPREFNQSEKDQQRDFILSVLEAHPSARDSRSYLRNFSPASTPPAASTANSAASSSNLPDVAAFPLSDSPTPTTAFASLSASSTQQNDALQTILKPQPSPDGLPTGKTQLATELLAPENRHTALVKIQGPFSDRQLESVAEGMVYLKKLGLVSIIVVDSEEWMNPQQPDPFQRETWAETRAKVIRLREEMKIQTLRLAAMLEKKGGRARPLLEGVLSVKGAEFQDTLTPIASTSDVPYEQPRPTADLFVDSLSGIRDAIRRGEIPIIPPVALDQNCFSLCVQANDAIRAISSGLADHSRRAGLRYEADHFWKVDVDLTPVRIMIINREGGIPSPARNGDPHLSINLASEFEYIKKSFVWQNSHPTSIENLSLISDCLSELPRTASAVLVSHKSPRSLIANLITNKPAHSPSLHPSKLANRNISAQPTIVRRGLPIAVFRSMKEINLEKLTILLQASFGKTLLAQPFYERLEKHLDFCIIAGDYQGVAIVTSEPTPKFSDADADEAPIAYLDKFAVLPSLQGDGTVDFLWGALRDESFGLGLQDALNPNVGGLQGKGEGRDLVWRSRENNPVNKWYFERSNGFLKIPPPPGSQNGFALFWCEAEDRKLTAKTQRKGVSNKLLQWSKAVGEIPACWQ